MRSFKFNIKGQEYEVEIKKVENNMAEVEVNGTPYSVEVQREQKTSKTPILVRPEPAVPRSAHKFRKKIGGVLEVHTPLPGTVIQVYVKDGDEVTKGEKLVMYEAMKMENTILAEKDGTISKLRIHPGDNMLEGDLLMEIA